MQENIFITLANINISLKGLSKNEKNFGMWSLKIKNFYSSQVKTKSIEDICNIQSAKERTLTKRQKNRQLKSNPEKRSE